MIIKGASRSGPSQLAAHLRRTDTNERVAVLELHSPLADLKEAFRDWQILANGTRGTKGLYHANIDPDGQYTMTAEQWKRCVDVLEEELGFQGQPRAVVMHEKNGRQHIHVVWQRTHVESMKLLHDGWSYAKHERASYRLEEEFGHEHVPGKHGKRDREKQPEPPKSEYSHSEAQQAERTGVDPRERKDQVTAIYEKCDNGQSLKAALEQNGYVLARGDRRAFVIVDEDGEIHSLSRQLKGVKAKDLQMFMKDIDRDTLPDVQQAKDMQARPQQAEAKKQPAPEPEPQPEKEPEPPHPDLAAQTAAATEERRREMLDRIAEGERLREEALDRQIAEAKAKQAQAATVRKSERQRAIENAVAVRIRDERMKLTASYTNEREQLRHVLQIEAKEKLKRFDEDQRRQRQKLAVALLAEQQARKGILSKLDRLIRPKRAKQLDDERKARAEALRTSHRTERDAVIAHLKREGQAELDALKERQAQRLRELESRKQHDIARYLREDEEARRLLEERQRTQRRSMKDKLERPPDKPTR